MEDIPSLEEEYVALNSNRTMNFVNFIDYYWDTRQFTQPFIQKVYHWYMKNKRSLNRINWVVQKLIKLLKQLYSQSDWKYWHTLLRIKGLPLIYLYLKFSVDINMFNQDVDDYEEKQENYALNEVNFANYHDTRFEAVDFTDSDYYERTFALIDSEDSSNEDQDSDTGEEQDYDVV